MKTNLRTMHKRKVRFRTHRLNLAERETAMSLAPSMVEAEPKSPSNVFPSPDSREMKERAKTILREWAVGDPVMFISRLSPIVLQGKVLGVNCRKLTIRWEDSFTGVFEVGRTFGWDCLEKAA